MTRTARLKERQAQDKTGPFLKEIAERVFGMRVDIVRSEHYHEGEIDVYLFREPDCELITYSYDINACNLMVWCNGRDSSNGTAPPVPRWDLEIEDAWQVVERMRTLDWAFELKSDPHPGIYGPDYLVSFGKVGHSRGPNVAEAICLAALQALTVPNPDPADGAP